MTPQEQPNSQDLIERFTRRYQKTSYSNAAAALGITKGYLSKLRSGEKPLTDQLRQKMEDLLPDSQAGDELLESLRLKLSMKRIAHTPLGDTELLNAQLIAKALVPIVEAYAERLAAERAVEARIDEAQKIYTNYVPSGTLIGKAVLKRIKRYKAELATLTKETKQ